MPRLPLLLPPAVLLAVLLCPPAVPENAPFLHVQTDRPSYRLGETVWFRVHAPSANAVTVDLLGPDGDRLERRALERRGEGPLSGCFPLSKDLAGGTFRISASVSGGPGHAAPIEVYDLELPELDLDLTILGDVHFPGGPVAASFRARDLRGRPIAGARVEYLATFGPVRIRESAGATNADGRALIRLTLPETVERGGHLAAGLVPSEGKTAAATARRIDVSASVSAVDAFPEGGAVIEGAPQRFGLLVRDRDGNPAAAEGRIIDDQGGAAIRFRTGAWGVAAVVVPGEPGRTYRAAIDRPAGVEATFPLPGPTGHEYSILTTVTNGRLAVEVRGREGTAGNRLRVLLAGEDGIILEQAITLRKSKDRPLPRAALDLRIPASGGPAFLFLIEGERAIARRPLFLGTGRRVDVAIRPKGNGPLFPGRQAEFEVLTTLAGKPVAADIALSLFQAESGGAAAAPTADIALRALVEPHLSFGAAAPADFLAEDEGAAERRDAFLLVNAARAYPAAGAPLIESDRDGDRESGRGRKVGLRDLAAGSPVLPGTVPPRPSAAAAETAETERQSPGRTAVRAAALERLLERARFTRSAREREPARSVRLQVPPEALLAVQNSGRALPQDIRVPASRVDCRRTLFWSDRVATGSDGRAAIRVRLNALVSDLAWSAQGFGGGLPASGRGIAGADAGFRTDFESPAHLQVGDIFDLMVSAQVTDGNRQPVRIEVLTPSSLKPLLRSRVDFDPRLDPRLYRFQFEVIAPAEREELRVMATRGLYRELHVRPFQVERREIELEIGEGGREPGGKTVTLKIPSNAVPGSIRAEASFFPAATANAIDWLRRLLRFPRGCFEQFTSTNLMNLVVLQAMLRRGEDPEVIENAFNMARAGFQRFEEFRDPISGGYRMFPGQPASVQATVVAVRHLALYGAIFDGAGMAELERALGWLEGQEIPDTELLYLTLSIHELGRTWKGSERVLAMVPRTLYETALIASCLACWPRGEPGNRSARREERRRARLEEVLDALDSRLSGNGGEASGGEEFGGRGMLGSSGEQLGVEVLSLAAVAFHDGGREERAGPLLDWLAERQAGGWWGTQGTAQAIRAISRVKPPGIAAGDVIQVSFEASPGGREMLVAHPAAVRPLRFERELPVDPGKTATLSLRTDSGLPAFYRLACAYRVADPVSSPRAPYRLHCHLSPVADTGSAAELTVRVEPAGNTSSSQVVARIGLPGGLAVKKGEMDEAARLAGLSHWELADGYLDLYWLQGERVFRSLEIPARAAIAGNFTGRPSVVYPYYQSGLEHYARPLRLKVNNTFGNIVDPAQAARERATQPVPVVR